MDLEKLSNEELRELYDNAQKEIEKRREQRDKELWENVVAAIKKYESEIGDISIQGCGECGCFDSDRLNEPGYLYLYY